MSVTCSGRRWSAGTRSLEIKIYLWEEKMCNHASCKGTIQRRHALALLGGTVAFGTGMVGWTLPALAEARVVGGRLSLKRDAGGKLLRAKTDGSSGVLRTSDQLFYLDADSDAEFTTASDGKVTEILIKAGGVLSLFGPQGTQQTNIITPNAAGAIRGTTTYFAWQAAEQRTYVCCCYGGVDLENGEGGGEKLRTSYHQAVILPQGGGVEAAPYPAPLNHYDDDISKLESLVDRQPRWQLPGGKMNFFAPQPVPVS